MHLRDTNHPPDPTGFMTDWLMTTTAIARSSAENATRLRAIIDLAPVPLARVRDDGAILALNGAAVALVGVERASEALRQPVARFVDRADQPELTAFLERVCAGEPGTIELAGRAASGIARTLEVTAAPLPVDDENRASALLVLRDVGARRALELAAQALSARAHEDATLLADRARTIDALRRRLGDLEAGRTPISGEHSGPSQDGAVPTPSDEIFSGGILDRGHPRDLPELRRSHAPEFDARPSGTAPPAPTVEAIGDGLAAEAVEHSTLRARIATLEAALDAANARGEAQALLARESAVDRVAILRTAEYLETQRSTLADELRHVRAAHQRAEDERAALDAALIEVRAAHQTQLADERQATSRLASRLDAVEAAHARALAGEAGLLIEVTRLREANKTAIADTVTRHAPDESETETLRAERDAMTERHADLERRVVELQTECGGFKEALKDALADFEDLTTWGKARSSLLAQSIRCRAGANIAGTKGFDDQPD